MSPSSLPAASIATAPPTLPLIYSAVKTGDRLFQGELVEGILDWVPVYEDATNPDAVTGVEPRLRRLSVIFTQDCDLEQDWGQRRAQPASDTDLSCVMLCPAWPAEERRAERDIKSDLWKPIRSNKNERYQYLAEVPNEADQAAEGHPALLLDFKQYFTVRTVELYRQLRSTPTNRPRRRCKLESPWREHLQSRFATYLARVGLPKDHFIPENRR